MSDLEKLSFEQAIERLEQVVALLESGDVPLEEAIELYQEGMKLSNLCNGKLKQVESKIEVLIQTDQGLSTENFTVTPSDKGE